MILRQLFFRRKMNFVARFFINSHVGMYRLTNGRIGGHMGAMTVLILTTKGRRSGKVFSNPVSYFERDGGYFIVASNGGATQSPSWFHNIKGNPEDVSIQVDAKKMKVKPQVILGENRRPIYAWIVSKASNFGEYEKRTAREIPLVFLKP
jgi:F420H(2)-dependent quinone reductase